MFRWRDVAIASGGFFVLLALVVYDLPHTLFRVDAFISRLAAPLQTFESIQFFLAVTAFGGGIGIIAVAIGLAYITRLSSAMLLRLTFLLALVLVGNRLIKDLFVRARPDVLTWFDVLSSFSFPSAHASGALALYGFVAVIWYRRTHKYSVLILPVLIILLVGLSRLVLNAHHFSDVIGGYLFGLLLLAVSFLIPFERLAKRYE
ncbi:MAG TPA: phosphatase PAP2 family protein [Candidatus Paceibacterota bacterium]